jgi:glycosyltransferase involved in cell wall biosynthesis
MTRRQGAINNDLPLVTIVTPSYNQGEYIEASIRSVLEQDYPRIEYLVIDGGSSDDTLDVLGRQTSRVRWISEPDRGQGDAIRKGFALARGEILAWLNSDDVYLPGAVSRVVAAFQESSSVALVYGNAEFIDGAGAVLGPCEQVEPFDLGRLINDLDFIVQPATFFRREAYAAVGGLDPSLTYCLDYELWIRMAQRSGATFIPDMLAQVRIHPMTKTSSGGLARLDEVERMIRRNGGKGLPTDFRREQYLELRRALAAAARRRQLARAARLAMRMMPYGARAAIRKLRRVHIKGRD